MGDGVANIVKAYHTAKQRNGVVTQPVWLPDRWSRVSSRLQKTNISHHGLVFIAFWLNWPVSIVMFFDIARYSFLRQVGKWSSLYLKISQAVHPLLEILLKRIFDRDFRLSMVWALLINFSSFHRAGYKYSIWRTPQRTVQTGSQRTFPDPARMAGPSHNDLEWRVSWILISPDKLASNWPFAA